MDLSFSDNSFCVFSFIFVESQHTIQSQKNEGVKLIKLILNGKETGSPPPTKELLQVQNVCSISRSHLCTGRGWE